MRFSLRTLATTIVFGSAILALDACAPAYEAYDPYAHPNTTARYLNNSNSYYRPSYAPGYRDPNYPPNYYYYPRY